MSTNSVDPVEVENERLRGRIQQLESELAVVLEEARILRTVIDKAEVAAQRGPRHIANVQLGGAIL